MKKLMLISGLLASALQMSAKDIYVNTPGTTLLLKAEEGKAVHVSYYGDRIQDADAIYRSFSLWEEAYPTFGDGCKAVTTLSVKHANGNMSTELVYLSDTQKDETEATQYTITMKDKLYDFSVDLNYKAYKNCDVIETWTEIHNNEKKTITLLEYMSGMLPIRQGNCWVSHQHGAWGAEAEITEEPLTPGVLEISDFTGTKNGATNRANLMISLDGKPHERFGRVIGAILMWSGNFKMSIYTGGKTPDPTEKKVHYLTAGINPYNSQYPLKKGETFTTPVLALTYSGEGEGGASRSFHRWARKNNKVHNGQQLRKILLNSWEGCYLEVNQQKMEKMMDGIKDLGGELFVMDDGWFGRKYRRATDDRGLGDWVTDTVKLPQGVPALEKTAAQRGLKWGIWIEPEMTNTRSELYEKHPDWVICHPDRKPITGRGGTQLTLDMSNPEVQDFVFSVVDNIMTETPNTYYIKWDCNCELKNYGSHFLDAESQSKLYVDYHFGLTKTLQRIRAKYPDLVIQCCASGGGRVCYGLMPYFDEFWVSDNTDAQQRLFIQWGTSMYFPVCAMAQHISASPNHQLGRVIPLKFRVDVAMTGRMGMEMRPSDLNEKEFNFVKQAFASYKELRPIIQQGDLYRLISPYEGNGFTSEMFVSEDKSEAVFFCYRFERYINEARPRFYFDGLDPDATYELKEINCESSRKDHWEGAKIPGKLLMNNGIEINLQQQFSSKVIRLKKV